MPSAAAGLQPSPRESHALLGGGYASSGPGGGASSGYGGGMFTGGACFHGEEVLQMHIDLLTEYERAEIREVSKVYWDGHTAGKPRAPLLAGDFNHGYDDDRGDYNIMMHDHLSYRYEILGIVGKGSFGQVVKAYDHKEGRLVAIKVIRNKTRFHKQGACSICSICSIRTAPLNHLAPAAAPYGCQGTLATADTARV